MPELPEDDAIILQGLVLASPALETVAPAGCPHLRGSLPACSYQPGRTPSPALPNPGALFLQEMVGMRSACPALEDPSGRLSLSSAEHRAKLSNMLKGNPGLVCRL